MSASMSNVFVGSATGLLKGINVHDGKTNNLLNNQKASKEKEICVICWNNSSQSQIAIGRREQSVDIFDLSSNEVVETYDLKGGTGPLKGLAKYDRKLIGCTESGLVTITETKCENNNTFSVGENIYSMQQNKYIPHQIATGGKENDLKIWDLNSTSTPVFKAKNVANDWLGLRVPVWVTDMCFINGEKIITSTGVHSIRLYDPKSKRRRPVLEVSYNEYPLTSLAIPSDENYVIVGNTKGYMALLDLRQKAMVHSYKGFAGSIRSIQCHETEPIVASCGLDRFLRIHDFNSRKLIHKIYMKSRLNCVLLAKDFGKPVDYSEEIEGDMAAEEVPMDNSEENEEGDDELWNSLKPVQINRKRKCKIDENDIKRRIKT